MKVISIINYKGGVGKTTLTANLAGELAYRGKKVLMIDLDPQASLTFSFIKPEEWKEHIASTQTIKNWFNTKKKEVAFADLIIEPLNAKSYTTKGKLHLISSHLELINVDLELATKLGGANLQQAKENFIKVHRRLITGINQIDPNLYDLILIEDNIKPLSGIIIMKKLLMIKSFNTKVILLSSNNEYIDNYDKYGFSDVISEPIDEDIFINKINKYLER